VLTAGQMATTGQMIEQVDPTATDWWLQQNIRWNNIELGDLLQRLENYYQQKLTYGNIDKKMKVTLTWDMTISLAANLSVLKAVTGYDIH